MNIAEFVLQPDLEKLVVVEAEIARKLQEKLGLPASQDRSSSS